MYGTVTVMLVQDNVVICRQTCFISAFPTPSLSVTEAAPLTAVAVQVSQRKVMVVDAMNNAPRVLLI